MTTKRPRTCTRAATPLRVGFFGLLGSGNIGNDGSLDAILDAVRTQHPDAEIGFLCAGPETISARYGAPADRLNWYRREYQTVSSPGELAMKVLAKGVDLVRTVRWVRRFDVVIIPGMGVLAADLPVRPWAFPYSIFLLSAAGRLLGRRIAFVGVGADRIQKRATRRLYVGAAKLAAYRSYRDERSRDAMAAMGVDTSADLVYADLVFALPTPDRPDGPTRTIGVGIMDYHGGNNDRHRADRLHADYLSTMTRFVRWLVEAGYAVRLLTGDQADEHVARAVAEDVRAHCPRGDPDRVTVDPPRSLQHLMTQLATVDLVVAMRYHNLLCALKMGRPVISIAYARKNDELLAGMGLGEFCQSAEALDYALLQEQFLRLMARREHFEAILVEANQAKTRKLEEQFGHLAIGILRRSEGRDCPTDGAMDPIR